MYPFKGQTLSNPTLKGIGSLGSDNNLGSHTLTINVLEKYKEMVLLRLSEVKLGTN